MNLFLNVKNFGRIEQARIALTGFNLFVGDNNSGKSYLLQLAEGLLKQLPTLSLAVARKLVKDDVKAYTFDNTALQQMISIINDILNNSKDIIIQDIFQAPVQIEALWLEVANFEQQFTVTSELTPTGDMRQFNICEENDKVAASLRTVKEISCAEGFAYSMVAILATKVLGISYFPELFSSRTIYLPSSRAGMLLLYRQFFANSKASEIPLAGEEQGQQASQPLPLPIMDFMRFLQTYKPSSIPKNEDLQRFIMEHLADGKISMGANEMQYQPANTNLVIQMPLCSSMINELTPIVQVLTATSNFKYIFYDEVETCLHPLKQIEMARLLVRIVNSGINLTVSTHSDTMAIALNNLFLLSFSHSAKKDDLLQELGYTSEDLLKTEPPRVYQFSRRGDKTIVTELTMSLNPRIGFKFEQFWKSGEKIYSDASAIMEASS